jgi:hypothetical protein
MWKALFECAGDNPGQEARILRGEISVRLEESCAAS